MSYILSLLIVLRLGWAVLPQNGYIHPDEFFQTVEVVAGDTLNISVVRTWEFTSSQPLRSVVLPQLTFSPVFKLLRYTDEISRFHMTGYRLIACYRLVMTILSLWIDICIFKICKIIGLKGFTANVLIASSYVTLTFQTRTFSNSFETVLFVSLMLLIMTCMRRDEENKRKRCGIQFLSDIDRTKDALEDMAGEPARDDESEGDYDLDSSFNELHKMAFDLRKRNKNTDFESKQQQQQPQIVQQHSDKSENCKVDRDSLSSDKLHIKKHQQTNRSTEHTSLYIYVGLMALTVTAGVFNRPTYVIFTLLPLLWWTDKFPVGENSLFKRVTVFLFAGLIFSIIFVAIDTIYFSSIEISSLFTIDGWRTVLDSYVITPLNFVMYNSMVTNLETHGHNPFYVHLLVNMPLLFGPMLMYLSKHLLSEAISMIKVLKRSKDVVTEKKLAAEANMSVEEKLKNNLKGAIFPFILFPAVALSFFPHQEARFLIPLLPLVVISMVLFCDRLGKIFWTICILFNILLSVVFGTLHQGGVIPCLLKLQQLTETESKKQNSSVTVIFSHTYMPPKHLLLIWKRNVELLDFKGADLQTVFNEIEKRKQSVSNLNNSSYGTKRKRVFLVIPGTLATEFISKYNKDLNLKSEEKFFPHLSLEDPPETKFVNSFRTLLNMLSLYLIEIE